MATNIPTTTIAGQTVWYLSQLPSYEDFVSFTESQTFEDRLPSFVSESLANSEVNTSFGGLNTYYENLFARTLQELPPKSAVYRYITLKADLRTLENMVYARQDSFSGPSMQDTVLSSLGHCYHPERFRDKLSKQSTKLAASEDVFEFLSILEETYLTVAIENALSSTYLTRVITAEVNRHNAMTAIRRGKRGQTKSQITPHLIKDTRLIHRLPVETLEFGDILGELGNLLQIAPANLSETTVETHLLHNEIHALNSAKYEGVDAERIVQYLEIVYHFISNVKLALAARRFGLPAEELQARLVNYTA